MLKNYITIALRALRKQAGYAAINVLGLAMGLTCCILIVLYVQDERSYDRFHENAEQIYRLRVERFSSGGETELSSQAAAPMAQAAMSDVPAIEASARLSRRTYLVQRGDRRFYEEGFFWADSSFFEVFSFGLRRGDRATVLQAPYSIVLTPEMARKYFGDEDPVGQPLQVEGWTMTVTGVADEVPPQSHFSYDMLASFHTLEAVTASPTSSWSWWNLSYHTYLLLNANADTEQVQASLRELPARYVGDQESGSGYRQFLYLQPLTAIHLTSHYDDELEPNGHTAYVYVFSAIAVFILVIACINFMNLATARSAQRAREVSLRKVVGAGRRQLIVQFLSESVVLALLALGVALVLIQAAIPLFNTLAAKELSLHYAAEWPFTLACVTFALAVGILAGMYPSFVLSGFRPIAVLKGDLATGRGGALLRKSLVVFQFAVSVTLIVGSAVVYQQLRFMQTTNLGFSKDQIVVINARNNETHGRRLADMYFGLKGALMDVAAVRSVTFSSAVPGRDQGSSVISRSRGFTDDGQTMSVVSVDHDFAETYGLDVAAGRDFSRAFATDDSAAFVINEAAMRAMGWNTPEEAVGQELTRQFQDTRTVVGVVKDFHFESLQREIYPVVFLVEPDWFNFVAVNIDTRSTPAAMAALEGVWDRFSPERPFQAFFLDDDYDRQYRSERRVAAVLGLFTGLAIFIACLGLFALAAFTAQQRTKEIGVRKALGATAANIVVLLSKEFTRLVVLGALVAAPVAYFLMQRWLEDFAYRIELSWTTFALAGVAALLIAWLTVSYQSLRTALTDPVKALRYE